MFDALRQLRKSKNVTCEDMARVLGLNTKSAYHKKENGKVPFSLSDAKKISDYFGKPVEDIFFDHEVSI
jgi:DNA-binding XRE family transcriptional regulator